VADFKIVKVPVAPGVELPARELDFEPVKEAWSEYKLEDGGKVKIRATALRIFRVVDDQGKPAFQPDGQPFVIVTQSGQVVATD
jgi:hypothetical protein